MKKIKMSRKIKIILILLFLNQISLLSFSQVYYSYDDAGNREYRIILKSAEIPQDSILSELPVLMEEEENFLTDEQKEEAVDKTFNSQSIKVYPNPTQGAVFIQFSSLSFEQQIELELWSPTGQKMERLRVTGLTTRINLWGKPVGIYLLKIYADGHSTTWKIVKQ